MSVLDHLTQIQTGWIIALWAGFGFILLVLVVGTILACILKNANKVFISMSIMVVLCIIEIFISLIGFFISSDQVSTTRYYPDKYNIEQMVIDYDARIIEDDREHKPYLVHYEGYGTEEWVYYVGKPDPQAKYLVN